MLGIILCAMYDKEFKNNVEQSLSVLTEAERQQESSNPMEIWNGGKWILTINESNVAYSSGAVDDLCFFVADVWNISLWGDQYLYAPSISTVDECEDRLTPSIDVSLTDLCWACPYCHTWDTEHDCPATFDQHIISYTPLWKGKEVQITSIDVCSIEHTYM